MRIVLKAQVCRKTGEINLSRREALFRRVALDRGVESGYRRARQEATPRVSFGGRL